MTGIFAMKRWCFFYVLPAGHPLRRQRGRDGLLGNCKKMRRVEHGWHPSGCTENGINMAGEQINAIDIHRYHPYFWGIEPLMILEVSSKFKEWIFSAGSASFQQSDLANLSQVLRTIRGSWSGCWDVPSGYVKIAIENGHRNSGFSHEKWWIFQ